MSAAALDTVMLSVVLGALGACLGSFLTVVVHRRPQGDQVLRGRSRCPACHTVLRPLELVPVLSWLALRGRCAHCGARIPARSLVVEVLGAAVPVAVVVGRGPSLETAVLAVVCTGVVLVACADAVIGVLPNPLLGALAATELAGFGLLAVRADAAGAWWRALAAAGVALAAGVAVYLLTRGALGEGDVKFAPLVAMPLGWVGWSAVFAGYLVTALAAAVIGVTASVRARRRRAVPFGPALAIGGVVTLVFGLRWPP